MSTPKTVRMSDEERSSAIAALGIAFSEGRLDVTEYDARCRAVAESRFLDEIEPLFDDLPEGLRTQGTAANILAVRDNPKLPERRQVFSIAEIEEARRSGQHTRLGILGLTSVGSISAGTVLTVGFGAPVFFNLMWVIPVVWLLLYVMKVGPESWYTPSPQQLNQMRLRRLRTEDRLRRAQLRADRRAKGEDIASAVLDFGRDLVGRRRQ